MDNKKPTPTIGDNSNVPGTYPKVDLMPKIIPSQTVHSNDPKAPNAVDPLNGGTPTNQATEVPVIDIELELGGTGTIIVGGILVDADYNPDLAGTKRIEVYDKMRKSDATVRLGLSAAKQPIMAAEWYFKPGAGEDMNGEKITFIQQELFQNPNFSFTNLLRQSLTFCDFGASHFEKVWRERGDGRIGWKKFAQRLPKTIYRYTLNDGVTPGITQYLPTGGQVEIPQWKLVSFILDMEGSNYEGQSMLRAAYMHWHYKDLYYRIDAIASERQGMGVPIIRVPAQATPQDKAKAKMIARNLRVNESAYVDLPPGFTLEYLDTHGKELKEVKEMIMHHDRQILKAFLAHFLDMGASHSGSKNISTDQSDLYKLAEQYLARVFQEPMQLVCNELIALNWSNLKPNEYPTLSHGQIGSIDIAVLSAALKDLTDAGIIIPDPSLEQHLRKSAQLPEPDDPKLVDDKDAERRKIGYPPPPPMLPGLPGQKGLPPGKPAPKAPSKFGEDLLLFKEELEAIISQKEEEEQE